MCPRRNAGLTLIELLIVITVMAILAVALLPAMDPQLQTQVESAGRIVAADLGYARSLAVTGASQYTVTFNTSAGSYTLTHTGTNSALNTLPKSPFRDPADSPTQQTVHLDKLPRLGVPVAIEQVVRVGSTLEPTTSVVFDPRGNTVDTRPTVVVLTTGQGAQKRRCLVVVNPVTGLCSVDADVNRLESVIPNNRLSAVDALGR